MVPTKTEGISSAGRSRQPCCGQHTEDPAISDEEAETAGQPVEDLTAALLAHLDGLAKLVEAHDPKTGAFRKRAYVLAMNCIKRYRKLGHILTSQSNFIALCEQPNSVLVVCLSSMTDARLLLQHREESS